VRQDSRNPAAIKQLLEAYPVPNGPNTLINGVPNGLAQFFASFSEPSTLDATSVRIDHNIGNRITIFGRYNYAPSQSSSRSFNVPNVVRVDTFDTQTFTAAATWAINPVISNDSRVNYSRFRGGEFREADNFGGGVPLPDSFFPSFGSLKVSNYSFRLGSVISYAVGKNSNNLQRQLNVVDSLSIVDGAHQSKLGVDYRRLDPIADANNYGQGVIFNSALQVFTGKPSTISISAGDPVTLTFTNLSLYGQDTWRATRRLTLTYGLRWDVNPPPTGEKGREPFTVIGFENPSTISLAPQATPFYQTTYNNFAPRIGAAYQLIQDRGRETVLRGGWGIFYDLGDGSLAGAAQSFPFRTSKNLANVAYPLDPVSATPAPFTLIPVGATIRTADPNLKLPRVYQWNVTVEQSLGSNQTLSAAYVAAVGQRLLRQERIVKPNASFNDIFVTRNTGSSNYHSLQLQFNRRLFRGLQALASYTWSRSIDTASNDSVALTPSEKIDASLDRGPSDFDIRHSFSAALTFNLPTPRTESVGKYLLRDWSFDMIFFARTAAPVNVIVTRDIGFGSFVFRPDLVAGKPIYLEDPSFPGGKVINRAAFVVPTGPRQGTLGRNSLRGFDVWQLDWAIRRQFKITERFNIQLRAEFFNILNHPNFADPDNQLTSGTFGQSTLMLGRALGSGGLTGGFNPLYQVGGPRSIQFALKLAF